MGAQRREILADLLLKWEDQYQRGQDVPASELAREYPGLVEELAIRIKAMKATGWLASPLTAGPSHDADPPNESSARRTLAHRYRLDELIALGGFAEVWRAYDPELQRSVAVKIPKAARGESAESFMAEARRVARLRHPAIVPVFDVGRENDQCFIVSDFMDGGSLATRIALGPVNPSQVIDWITSVAEALEYAHVNGVIHRDCKPANILINHHGEALLADFGIAQSANKTGRFDPSLGTLFYMSPEHLEGRPITPVSDVFSLAVVLYEALSREMPYSSSDPNVIRHEISTGWKKPWPKSIPERLIPVLSKALSRNPQKRHNSAAHFGADLTQAWAAKPRRWLRWRLVLLMLPVLVGISLLWPRTPQSAAPAVLRAIPDMTDIQHGAHGLSERVQMLARPITDRHARETELRRGRAIAKALEARRHFDAGRWSEAAELARDALELDPSSACYHHQRAACLFNMQDYARALVSFTRATEIEPANPVFQLHRAYCLKHLKRDAEAAEAFALVEQLSSR